MAADDSQFTESFDEHRDDDGTEVIFRSETEIPETVGRYRVERWLGKGGFGAVFLGFDPQLKRRVAIKVPHPHLIHNRVAAESYLEEARTTANLDHPNIVPVFDVGTSDDFPCFIVSRYIEGTDLGARHQSQPLSIRESAELIATVASALHYAHKKGLVHRDIKPGNLMVDRENRPYVVDFGLALREENLGKGPSYVGTAAFMSPEQARREGHRVDGRSDIFSLGVVLYYLLVGHRPFHADTKEELLVQIASFEAKPLRQYDDRIPKELERICLKSMSKKASERYTTAEDFAEDLRMFLVDLADSEKSGSSSGIAADMNSSDSAKSANVAESTKVNSQGHLSDTQSFNYSSQPVKIIPKGLRSFEQDDF